jgi:hypothetical protein
MRMLRFRMHHNADNSRPDDVYVVSYNQQCKFYVVYGYLVEAHIFVSLGHIGLL